MVRFLFVLVIAIVGLFGATALAGEFPIHVYMDPYSLDTAEVVRVWIGARLGLHYSNSSNQANQES